MADIVESMGRVFHMHVEDGVANVVIESSMGLLMIASGGISVTGSWPDSSQWGVKTFEEFLCSRTPSWIVSKMLGQEVMIFDEERTRTALIEGCSGVGLRYISQLMQNIDARGDIQPDGYDAAEAVNEILGEPVDEWIFMQTTELASFLIDSVLPALLQRIAPPPVVTNQTTLKLC